MSGFLAIMPYVWSEFLILLYHCNLQVRSCRLICDLRMLLVFIWLRCETAFAPETSTKRRDFRYTDQTNLVRI